VEAQTVSPMPGMPRFPALDGWRAISILLVLAGHLFPLGPKAYLINESIAALGMAIFFTLSGFLITTTLLHRSHRATCMAIYDHCADNRPGPNLILCGPAFLLFQFATVLVDQLYGAFVESLRRDAVLPRRRSTIPGIRPARTVEHTVDMPVGNGASHSGTRTLVDCDERSRR